MSEANRPPLTSVPLPVAAPRGVALLLREAESAGAATNPLIPFDEPLGPVRSHLALSGDGEICELVLAGDAAQAPISHPAISAMDVISAARFAAHTDAVAPPMYLCTKMRCLVPALTQAGTPCDAISPADAERTLLAQGDVARMHAAAHPCGRCAELERCYPGDGAYAFALDRLIPLSTHRMPLVTPRVGEWSWGEASRVIAGRDAVAAAETSTQVAALDQKRRELAKTMASHAPPLLLSGETDGRELLEILRLKLGVALSSLRELERVWTVGGRPHLCWTSETVRVMWSAPGALPASNWGLSAILRRAGLHPMSAHAGADGAALPAPPIFADAAFLPADVPDAARYFGQPRPAAVNLRSAKSEPGGARVEALVEDSGIDWHRLTPLDAIRATGEGWVGEFTPSTSRDAGDGDALRVSGRITGPRAAECKTGITLDDATVCWFPRFGEACDLHAFGMLLAEMLFSTDERDGPAARRAAADSRDELMDALRALPTEKRGEEAWRWIAARAAIDAPGALWSRRNLLETREARAAAKLDVLPLGLWQAVVGLAVRCLWGIPGFGYCAGRAERVPRIAGVGATPRVELEGLVALLDDQLFGRTVPSARVREMLRG